MLINSPNHDSPLQESRAQIIEDYRKANSKLFKVVDILTFLSEMLNTSSTADTMLSNCGRDGLAALLSRLSMDCNEVLDGIPYPDTFAALIAKEQEGRE